MHLQTSRLGHWIEIDGPSDGIPVVFSNSLGASTAMWRPQVEALAGEYRVVRYDQRGHGRSEVTAGPYPFSTLVDDAVALLDALELERVHFVGLSLGGMTALGLALHHAQRLRSITAANCIAVVPPAGHTLWDERARLAREQGLAALVPSSLERWFTAPTRAARAAELAWVGDMLAATPVAGYVATCEALKTLDCFDALPRIAVPTLFIAGTHDQGAPLATMQAMHARVRGSRLVELDAAHVSNLERPAEFNAVVLDFLRGLS
ncbi:MAG: alpha/beta fold hydrolase [Gammaproteobacteria bacterium]